MKKKVDVSKQTMTQNTDYVFILELRNGVVGEGGEFRYGGRYSGRDNCLSDSWNGGCLSGNAQHCWMLRWKAANRCVSGHCRCLCWSYT